MIANKSPFFLYSGLIFIFLGVVNLLLAFMTLGVGGVKLSPGGNEVPSIAEFLGPGQETMFATFIIASILVIAGIFFIMKSKGKELSYEPNNAGLEQSTKKKPVQAKA
jgi:hypothetical protein